MARCLIGQDGNLPAPRRGTRMYARDVPTKSDTAGYVLAAGVEPAPSWPTSTRATCPNDRSANDLHQHPPCGHQRAPAPAPTRKRAAPAPAPNLRPWRTDEIGHREHRAAPAPARTRAPGSTSGHPHRAPVLMPTRYRRNRTLPRVSTSGQHRAAPAGSTSTRHSLAACPHTLTSGHQRA
jgi:hypothetical protein